MSGMDKEGYLPSMLPQDTTLGNNYCSFLLLYLMLLLSLPLSVGFTRGLYENDRPHSKA